MKKKGRRICGSLVFIEVYSTIIDCYYSATLSGIILLRSVCGDRLL